MKTERDMIEGPEAWERFQNAIKALIKFSPVNVAANECSDTDHRADVGSSDEPFGAVVSNFDWHRVFGS